MKNKFVKYDIVTISIDDAEPQKVNGTKGIVIDYCPSDINDTWRYNVSVFADDGLCWEFYEYELLSTGKKAKPEDLSDLEPSGTTIKVLVDPKTGEGSFKDPDWFEKLDDNQK